ncbi:hypothetical protein AC579_6213 [Pseudocercospora musae]|uniref:Uncharacterized protein n=1 Tax=Pseudocercospora musae TaxID=113226 RepID=A0A139IC73_9PEZI|nr:hypothetical protein AC579_6213 [Pseudocercospora musae]
MRILLMIFLLTSIASCATLQHDLLDKPILSAVLVAVVEVGVHVRNLVIMLGVLVADVVIYVNIADEEFEWCC